MFIEKIITKRQLSNFDCLSFEPVARDWSVITLSLFLSVQLNTPICVHSNLNIRKSLGTVLQIDTVCGSRIEHNRWPPNQIGIKLEFVRTYFIPNLNTHILIASLGVQTPGFLSFLIDNC